MNKYTEDIADTNNVVFLFTGPHCGQCKMIKPRLEKQAADQDEFTFYEVDTSTDTGIQLAKRYKVSMLPTAVVIKNGNETVLTGAGQVNMNNIINA